LWNPRFVTQIGEFGESLVIYHKYDNYSGYFGGGNEADPNEKILLEKADIVFVSSMGLYEMHKRHCREIEFVPNGVDYDYFSTISASSVPLPDDLQKIPGPRVGYVGVINEKVDFRLLKYLCDSHPEWSILLVGPVKVRHQPFIDDLESLKTCRNCYFLGSKSHKEVPRYIAGLDVAMMCYLINDWTYYGYPLKMHEYLACGKPIVSTDLPAVREFRDVVRIATSIAEWEEAIAGYLSIDSKEEISRRMSVARENSWSERIRRIERIIGNHIGDEKS